jgi:nitroreductase
MDVYDAINSRRSVRKFDGDRGVDRILVEKLLRAAVRAPNAGNAQPWRFIVVYDTALKERLSEVAQGQKFVANAPVAVVVCVDLGVADKAYGQRGTELYCLQDTGAAIENLMLAACAEGLGTCWVGAFDEPAAALALGLSAGVRPVAMVAIGFQASQPREKGRLELDEITEWR